MIKNAFQKSSSRRGSFRRLRPWNRDRSGIGDPPGRIRTGIRLSCARNTKRWLDSILKEVPRTWKLEFKFQIVAEFLNYEETSLGTRARAKFANYKALRSRWRETQTFSESREDWGSQNQSPLIIEGPAAIRIFPESEVLPQSPRDEAVGDFGAK